MNERIGMRHVFVVVAALAIAILACTPSERNAESAVEPIPPAQPPPANENTNVEAGQTTGNQPVANQASTTTVRGRANVVANIRAQPGPNCQIIGSVPANAEIQLLIRTTSPTEYWYQTNYLGASNLGWVYHQPLTLLNDDSSLPRVPEQSCAAPAQPAGPSCGDGACNGDETCATCNADCGDCPIPEGACQLGPGNCCGDGICQTDEGADWCGDCLEELATCGNGSLDAGEECDPPGSTCGMAIVPGTCTDTCACNIPPIDDDFIPPGPGSCGNGSCDEGESPCSCVEDCPGLCAAVDLCDINPAACIFEADRCDIQPFLPECSD